MLERVWRRGNPPTRWEHKLVQPLGKTVWSFLKNLKTVLPYDLLLGICLKKTLIWKDRCTPIFTVTLFTIARTCVSHSVMSDCSPPGSSVHEILENSWIQEYWSGLPFPSLGTSPTQESNLCLQHCRQFFLFLPSEPPGKPKRTWKQSRCPLRDERIKKMWCTE